MNINKTSALLLISLFLYGCNNEISEFKKRTLAFDQTVTIGGVFDNRNECSDISWEEKEDKNGRIIIRYSCYLNDVVDLIQSKKNSELESLKADSSNANRTIDALIKSWNTSLSKVDKVITELKVKQQGISGEIRISIEERDKILAKKNIEDLENDLQNKIRIRDEIIEYYNSTDPEHPVVYYKKKDKNNPNWPYFYPNKESSSMIRRVTKSYPSLYSLTDGLKELDNVIVRYTHLRDGTEENYKKAYYQKVKLLIEIYDAFKLLVEEAKSDVKNIESVIAKRNKSVDKVKQLQTKLLSIKSKIKGKNKEKEEWESKIRDYTDNYDEEVQYHKGFVNNKMNIIRKKYDVHNIEEVVVWVKNLKSGGYILAGGQIFLYRNDTNEAVTIGNFNIADLYQQKNYNQYMLDRVLQKL